MGSRSEPTSPVSPNSLKQRLKAFRLPCFRRSAHDVLSASSSPVAVPPTYHRRKLRFLRPLSYSHLKSPDIKVKCRALLSQIRDCHRGSRSRRSSSLDFRYDPLSYSLNFDDGDDAKYDGFFARNFVDSLSQSSPPCASTSGAVDITVAS